DVLRFRPRRRPFPRRLARTDRRSPESSGAPATDDDSPYPRPERNPLMKFTMRLTMNLMMKSILLALLLNAPLAVAQQPPPSPDSDPIGRYLIPPELVMSQSGQIGLSDKQRTTIKGEIQKMQTKFID